MRFNFFRRVQRVLLGNKPDWRPFFTQYANTKSFEILPFELNAQTILLPEIDLIMPMELSEYDLLRNSPSALSRCLIPTPDHVRIANDKLLFCRWMIDNGFGDYVPNIIENVEQASFPCIHKAKIGEFGSNSNIIHTKNDLKHVVETTADPDNFFFQNYIFGDTEYATHLISVNGNILYKSTMTYTHADTIHVKGICSAPTLQIARYNTAPPQIISIIKRMQYTGIACIDFKIEHGQIYVFELNPRMGASFASSGGDYLKSYAAGLRRNS